MTTTLNASTAGAGGFIATSDNSGSLALQTAGTTAVTIDTSQNVGIGTASPTNKLQVSASSDDGIRISATSDTSLIFSETTANKNWKLKPSGGDLYWQYSATAYNSGYSSLMALTASGNLLVGTTSAITVSGVGGASSISTGSSVWATVVRNSHASAPWGLAVQYSGASPNNTTQNFLWCTDSGDTNRFNVRSNGGVVNYQANNSNLSDRREKTNFAPSKSYLDIVCAIPVQTFNYIDQNLEEDGGLTLGIIAQDVQAVAPELVSESNWGTEENPKMRLSIYQTDLQYALMKSIQELKAINDTQAETINALTARVVALESRGTV